MTLIQAFKKFFLITAVVLCTCTSVCAVESPSYVIKNADFMTGMGAGISTDAVSDGSKITADESSSDEAEDVVSAIDVGELMENVQNEDESGGFWNVIADFFASIWNFLVRIFQKIVSIF